MFTRALAGRVSVAQAQGSGTRGPVLPLHDPASGEGGLDRREAERAADARFVRLLELLPPLTPAGVRLVTRTVAGGIFECLLDTAIELETDLLAVGTRGRGWFATVVLGSTASDVLRRGRRSALMVPPPTAAERIELELRVNGTVEFSRAADWGPVLDAVTHRNAGRTARLEVLGTGIRGGLCTPTARVSWAPRTTRGMPA